MKPITILIAEDHAIVREGFHLMLELESDLAVVGEASDGREAIAQAKKLRPAVVLMDIAMPRLNGLEATRQLLKANAATKVIILSAYGDDSYVQAAMAAGARGFLLKQSSAHEVCQAIRAVQKGEIFFSRAISRRRKNLQAQSPGQPEGASLNSVKLTSREMEVLQLIAEGRANKETAAELGIGMKTVEKHREHLMRKLDIHDTASLTRYAISAGIVESHVQVTVG